MGWIDELLCSITVNVACGSVKRELIVAGDKGQAMLGKTF